MTLSVSDTT